MICPGISANRVDLMSRLGSFIEGVDRADVAERVDQGIVSSPFTRWLKSKLTIVA